uniref:EGF-like domain-containing protein n=1 Tax=Heterorhabditis bacteriophora TaxID=37862 RepID=A0A1I7WSW9_HETBA
MPSTSYQKFVVTGVVEHASFSSKFQRTMFFAMPNPKDTNSLCVSGVENDYGECICNESYSGDYCTDRICQNGGTPSLTTCVCPNGYYGENCEKCKHDYHRIFM